MLCGHRTPWSGTPPPYMNRELSSRNENQKPRQTRGRWGSKNQEGKNRPDLRNIRPDDLTDSTRLDALLSQAIANGAVTSSQAARLQWFGAAERAVEVATHNPCGFFAAIIRQGLWHHVSNEQEDAARRKLAKLDYDVPLDEYARERPPFGPRRTTASPPTASNANVAGSGINSPVIRTPTGLSRRVSPLDDPNCQSGAVRGSFEKLHKREPGSNWSPMLCSPMTRVSPAGMMTLKGSSSNSSSTVGCGPTIGKSTPIIRLQICRLLSRLGTVKARRLIVG